MAGTPINFWRWRIRPIRIDGRLDAAHGQADMQKPKAMPDTRHQWALSLAAVFIPPLLALILFALSIGALIIPATREALMERKRETLQAMVGAAISQLEIAHASPDPRSQAEAIRQLRGWRYGPDHKDYLWIMDRQLRMVLHPYRPDLEGQSLADFRDAAGKRVFVESLAIIDRHGEGYVDYFWQWQDDPHRIKPKLSFIREFKPWGWIIGTGIYVDDVQAEVRRVTGHLYTIALLAGAGMLFLLAIGIRQGWRSEKLRRDAERRLAESRERYRALAHASADLAILFIHGRVAGANRTACTLLNRTETELLGRTADSLLPSSAQPLLTALQAGQSAPECETALTGDNQLIPVALTCSVLHVHGEEAVMLAGRDLRPTLQIPPGSDETLPWSTLGLGCLKLTGDKKMSVLSANPPAARLLTGADKPDLAGRSLMALLPPSEFAVLNHELTSRGSVQGLILRPAPNRGVRFWLTGTQAILADAGNGIEARPVTPLDERSGYRYPTLTSLAGLVKAGQRPDLILHAARRIVDELFVQAGQQALLSGETPSAPFCLLAVGSIGRGEPTLQPDQDTCLLFADPDGDPAAYTAFGRQVTEACAAAGIPPCKMAHTAANPAWILSLDQWKHQFSQWIRLAEPEALLEVNIYFDFRTLWGNPALEGVLRRHIFDCVADRPVFLRHLAGDTLQFKAPLDLLGRIRADQRGDESLNLKAVLLHFVNFARIYALRHRISETGTVARLNALHQTGHLPPDFVQDTLDAWDYLMGLRLRGQVESLERGAVPDNCVLLSRLSAWDRNALKYALSHIAHLQHRLTADLINPA